MINQTAEYALRAIVRLAGGDGSPTNRKQIAAATQVPQEYLTKVLQQLERASLVRIKRGPGGGYSLDCDPEETSVYDIVKAVSSLPRITECPLGIEDHIQLCPLHRKLDEAAEQVEKAFRQTTIAELVPSKQKRKGCKFPIEL